MWIGGWVGGLGACLIFSLLPLGWVGAGLTSSSSSSSFPPSLLLPDLAKGLEHQSLHGVPAEVGAAEELEPFLLCFAGWVGGRVGWVSDAS